MVETSIEMRFVRDISDMTGCLEYSWVPQGLRHHIELEPKDRLGIVRDVLPIGLKPTHVQVYVLTNNERVSIEMWQFPPGPPAHGDLIAASVEVRQESGEVIGTAYFEDGSTIATERKLDHISRPCPQIPTK